MKRNLFLRLFVRVYSVVSFSYGSYNSSRKHLTAVDSDYYMMNYDYELLPSNIGGGNNTSSNPDAKSDSLILPNPETLDLKYTVDNLPNVELPDDSLADTDLRDHDFIDNLMYVYYGSHNRNESNYGPEIIIIGSVLSCAAQLLTIFCVLLRKNLNGKREMNKMFLHLMICLCLSNLVFMLGVYSTKNTIKCRVVALMLHYLHLLTAFWIFLYCYYVYKCFTNNRIFVKMKYLFITTYGLPAVISLISFIIAPKSYETKKFCFVSIQKGMMINYMLPISILIVATTLYSLNGLRKINMELSKLEMTSSVESLIMLRNEMSSVSEETTNEEVASLKECKSCLKVLCVVQTSYDVVWFVAVLALENVTYSNSMPIFYTIFSFLLNWYIFAKTKAFLPTLATNPEITDLEIANIKDEEDKSATGGGQMMSMSQRSSSDNIPLLINADVVSETHELRYQDTISTISS